MIEPADDPPHNTPMIDSSGIPGAPQTWRLGDGAPPGGAYVALVPGSDAPILDIDLPESLKGAARERVAARQLSEALSLPPGGFEMHPILPKGAKNWSRVVIVETKKAVSWRAALTKNCVGLLPDFMALPAAPELWTLTVDGDRVAARLGAEDGFTAELGLATAQLSRIEEPKAVLRLGTAAEELDDLLAGMDLDLHTDLDALTGAGVAPLKWVDGTAGLNLQSPPSAAVDRIGDTLRRWRTGAIAATLGTAAWLGAVWLETQAARDQAALAERRIESLVRAHFVPGGPLLDVRAQVSGALDAALQPDIIQLQGVPAMTQFQIAAETLTRDGARVISALYQPETGLETAVATSTFSVLDEIIIGLQDADFLVEQMESRSEQAGGVVARLRLELFE